MCWGGYQPDHDSLQQAPVSLAANTRFSVFGHETDAATSRYQPHMIAFLSVAMAMTRIFFRIISNGR